MTGESQRHNRGIRALTVREAAMQLDQVLERYGELLKPGGDSSDDLRAGTGAKTSAIRQLGCYDEALFLVAMLRYLESRLDHQSKSKMIDGNNSSTISRSTNCGGAVPSNMKQANPETKAKVRLLLVLSLTYLHASVRAHSDTQWRMNGDPTRMR